MNLNTYLIFLQEDILNENKWKALVKMGRLSEPAVKRILQLTHDADPLYVKQLLKLGKGKQAAEYLAKKGIAKSPAEWTAGVEKGTENILKQHGFTVRNIPHNSFAKKLDLKPGEKLKNTWQSHSVINKHTGKGTIFVPNDKVVPPKEKLWHAIVKRHETDELRVGRKAEKILGTGGRGYVTSHSTKGNHMADEVLRREKELLYFSRQMYPEESAQAVASRVATGEYMPFQFKAKKQMDKELIANLKKAKDDYIKFVKEARSAPIKDRLEAYKIAIEKFKSSNLSKKQFILAKKRLLHVFKLKTRKR
jgi:hypothetical protein